MSMLFLVPIVFVCVLVIGARQHALAVLGHDGAHYSISKNRRINDALACVLCFWPLGFNLPGYRPFHFAHHRFLGTDRDPELLHKESKQVFLGIPVNQWTVPMKRWKFIAYIVGDWMGGSLLHLAYLVKLVSPPDFRAALPIFIGPVVAVLFIWHEMSWIPLLWYGSLITSFWMFFRLRIWMEHVGTSGTHVVQPNAIERFFITPHNIWVHEVHHDNPGMPLWALPDARPKTRQAKTVRELFRSFLDQDSGEDLAAAVLDTHVAGSRMESRRGMP